MVEHRPTRQIEDELADARNKRGRASAVVEEQTERELALMKELRASQAELLDAYRQNVANAENKLSEIDRWLEARRRG